MGTVQDNWTLEKSKNQLYYCLEFLWTCRHVTRPFPILYSDVIQIRDPQWSGFQGIAKKPDQNAEISQNLTLCPLFDCQILQDTDYGLNIL